MSNGSDVDDSHQNSSLKKSKRKHSSLSSHEEDIKPKLQRLHSEEKGDTESIGVQAELHLPTSSDGEPYIDLGKQKRLAVRMFKGKPLVDIREYYGDKGQEKPGKKGISLTLDQWKNLQTNVQVVDHLLSNITQDK